MMIKALSILSILGIVSSLYIALLYERTSSKLKLLQEQHTKLQSDYKDCSESKDKLVESRAITEQVVAKQVKDLIALENEKKSLKDQLKSIPKKCPKHIVNNTGTQDESIQEEYVDIDAPFDDDYLGVFKQLSKDKRDSNSP
jgi:chromosome segregation ATPase